MIFDALDRFLFTAGAGIALITSTDKSKATLSGTSLVYSDAFVIPGGTGFTQAMYLNVFYDTANVATSTGTAQFDVEASDDGGNTWYLLSSGAKNQIALTTSNKDGAFAIPVVTQTANRLRLKTLMTGTTPTINVTADLNISPIRP